MPSTSEGSVDALPIGTMFAPTSACGAPAGGTSAIAARAALCAVPASVVPRMGPTHRARHRQLAQKGGSMTEGRWFVVQDGIEFGPYTIDQVRDLVHAGQVTPLSQVRTAHSSDYHAAQLIRGLFPDLPAAARPHIHPADAAPAAAGGPPGAGGAAVLAGPLELPGRPALPEWRHLWPLATLILLMGWIIGGLLCPELSYRPGAELPVLVLGLGSVPLASAALVFLIRPARMPFRAALSACLFTGTIGIVALLILQWASTMPTYGMIGHGGRSSGLLPLLRAIGSAYSLTHSSAIGLRWCGFVFGVGLCEEATKLLPLLLLLLLWGRDSALGMRGFLLVGAASGLGFGIGEALYAYAPWNGNLAVGSNIIRWYSVVPAHAVYTTVCAAFLWRLAERFIGAQSGWERAVVVATAVGVMAVVHGTYDTVCSLGVVPALLMAVLSLWLLVAVLRWVMLGEGPTLDQPAGDLTLMITPARLAAGFAASAMALAIAMAMGLDPAVAHPAAPHACARAIPSPGPAAVVSDRRQQHPGPLYAAAR